MAKTPGRPFHTASDADIKRGLVSDVYCVVKGGWVARGLPPPRTIQEFVLDRRQRVSLDTLRRQGERSDS